MVIRSKLQRYSEPCFLRIISAEPQMDPDLREGEVVVEEIFRGVGKGLVAYSAVAYKTDYQLVPKHKEEKYIKAYEDYASTGCKIFPQIVEMPPLLKLIAERKDHSSKVFTFSIIPGSSKSRIAQDGESANVTISPSLGRPESPEFYEGVLEKYNLQKE